MPSLRSFVQKSTVDISENNLERGRVFFYTLGHQVGSYHNPGNFCWVAPATGTVVLEVWGASGSSGTSCCCGYGLPGNPGAYAKRSYNVVANCYICGCFGNACNNLSTFRGCSDPTVVCFTAGGSTLGICAQGGRGGNTICMTSGSIFCCFAGNGYCATNCGTGIGFICNHSTSGWIPTSCGGDINCSGAISCVYFGNCNPCCICFHTNYVKTAAGTFSVEPSTAIFSVDYNTYATGSSGVVHQAMANAIAGLSRTPGILPHVTCWTSYSACACYQAYGCMSHFGVGIPGGPTIGFSNVHDYGQRGSHGAVRIQFIAS